MNGISGVEMPLPATWDRCRSAALIPARVDTSSMVPMSTCPEVTAPARVVGSGMNWARTVRKRAGPLLLRASEPQE